MRWTNKSCHLTMLGIHACNQDLDSWKVILEARIERECPYTCLRILCLEHDHCLHSNFVLEVSRRVHSVQSRKNTIILCFYAVFHLLYLNAI